MAGGDVASVSLDLAYGSDGVRSEGVGAWCSVRFMGELLSLRSPTHCEPEKFRHRSRNPGTAAGPPEISPDDGRATPGIR